MVDTQSIIVRLKKGLSIEDTDKVKQAITDMGGKIGHVYKTTFSGFQATIPKDSVSTLSNHEHVEGVEHDSEVHTQ